MNASVIRLHRQRPDVRRPFEMPAYPVPPVLGIGLNLLLGFFISPRTWAMGLGWLVLGGVVYYALGRLRSRGAGPPESDVESATGPETDVPGTGDD